MILLIFCTHELMYLLYADPTGVPDTAVAAMIKAKTTHVRRLPMEELQMLARWLDANKGATLPFLDRPPFHCLSLALHCLSTAFR